METINRRDFLTRATMGAAAMAAPVVNGACRASSNGAAAPSASRSSATSGYSGGRSAFLLKNAPLMDRIWGIPTSFEVTLAWKRRHSSPSFPPKAGSRNSPDAPSCSAS
ncbi:MAG: twin-arginine translocation signal domain-containing protein, partial [Candidatus Aminicenantales bacterium]